ncbi:unnamed protein product, partial [Musa hybrid cultivar]
AHVPDKRAIRTPDDERQRESCDQVFARGPRSKTSVAMGCRKCEKPRATYRKGLWSREEDEKLKSHIDRHGHGSWSSLPAKAGESLRFRGKGRRRRRGGAQRWLNYPRPGLKHGTFSPLEMETVAKLLSILITFKFARIISVDLEL